MATLAELFDLAQRFHQGGDLGNAERLYRQILEADSSQAMVYANLGVILLGSGRGQEALGCFKKAITLNPSQAETHYYLGNALLNQGQFTEATRCYRQALALNPNLGEAYTNLGLVLAGQGSLAEAADCFLQAVCLNRQGANEHYNLGTALKDLGRPIQAVACFRQALGCDSNHLNAHINLGNTLKGLGQPIEAEACYRQALRIDPNHADACTNLGVVLFEQGQMDEARVCFQQTLRIDPNHAHAYYHLGNSLKDQGQPAQAEECYRQTLNRIPNHADACNNLGIVLFRQGRLEEAIQCYGQVLRLNPSHEDAYGNLGIILKEMGNLLEAGACFKKALELRPDDAGAHGNLVYTLQYNPDHDAAAILNECRRWNQQHAEPWARFILPHPNDKSPERRLRIGYVSPDLREHPVGRFLLPLLAANDHARFEIFCYSDVKVADPITVKCQSHADVWRPIFNKSAEQVAQLVRQDRIDILVDLAMHTGNNRLLVFARKPAPVQVTYLAYCGTTGLDTMDYRLTDPYLDPPGQNDSFYTERSIYLPDTYWCYQPIFESPMSTALPALKTGHVTFGCLNNFSKISVPTLETWSRILQAIPESRLILNSPVGNQRARIGDFLSERNVCPDRVHFVDRVPLSEYFRTYDRIDLALDPFPFGGGTTTCDALWMGVPVVTLAGQRAVGRGGVSILSNLGLTEWIAQSAEKYVRIAMEWANDLPRLGALRASLRERMRQSPLMDAPRFARNVEAAYRGMWRKWCANPPV